MKFTKLLVALAVSAAASTAGAYTIFSGIDNNGNAGAQVAPTNSSTAETSFKANLVGVGTENFEGQSGSAPLTLNFGVAGTATLNGGGSVATNAPGATNGAGRYSVPGGTHYWEVSAGGAGSFDVDFSNAIAAFGFYGVDLGDFGGTLTVKMYNGATLVGTQLVNLAAQNVADGSIVYFGLLADNAGEEFTKVQFISTSGSGDVFAFDSFTIGTMEQVSRVPEPATLALLGLGLAGLGAARRRKQ